MAKYLPFEKVIFNLLGKTFSALIVLDQTSLKCGHSKGYLTTIHQERICAKKP